MQHKIGWIYPEKNGFILTASATPKSVAKWHANQVEGNVIEIIAPNKGDLLPIGSTDLGRSRKFFAKDLDLFVSYVAEAIFSSLKNKG